MSDNPQAFPLPASSFGPAGDMAHSEAGMTLRDYFAAKAMQAMLSVVWKDIITREHEHEGLTESDAVESAYIVADAMLKARESV